MPRRVDQRLRRGQIAEAVWSVTVARGLESASLRQVAAEAGVSVGLLQHYFQDKDEMLLFALDTLIAQVGRRIARATAAVANPDDSQGLIRATLMELLPLDGQRAVEAHVASAFLARAAVDVNVSAHLHERHARVHGFLLTQLRCGGTRRPAQAADILLALVDGLSLHTLAGLRLPENAVAALDAELDNILDGGSTILTRAEGEGSVVGRTARAAALPVGRARLG